MKWVPQLLSLYNELLLMCVLSSQRERNALILASYLAFPIWLMTSRKRVAAPKIPGWCVMASVHLPCLIGIVRQPNEGELLAWMSYSVVRVRKPVLKWSHG